MEVLNIEGVIGQKGDTILAPGEKVFSFADLENFLASYGGGPFEAVIKSPGGSVEEGFKIFDKLKEYDVTTVALTANSIASVIFLAGKVRKITPTSQLIIHNAWISGEDLAGEKLNFHTLQALTQIFAETDLRILSVYSSVSGPNKASKILALMAEETNLDAATAIALGFATEILEEDYAALAFRNRVITYSQNYIKLIAKEEEAKKEQNQILINTKMKDEDKVGAFEKMLKGLKNLFKLQLKNMATTTSEGVAIFIAGAEEDGLLGKSVYLAEEGLPTETPAPAGSHVLEDGTTIVVDEAGLITEVIEAAPVEDVEALKADFAATTLAMEEEKQKLEAKVAAQAKLIADGNKKLEKLNADFLDLKNAVLGDPDDKKKEAPVDFAKLTPGERIKARAMAKAENI